MSNKNTISLNTDYNFILNKNANFEGNVKIDENLSIGGAFSVDNHLYAKSIESEKITLNEDDFVTKNFIAQKLNNNLHRDEDELTKDNKNIIILLCEENNVNICGTFLLKFKDSNLKKIDIKLDKPQDSLNCCITNYSSEVENYEINKYTYNDKNYYVLSLSSNIDLSENSFDIWFYGLVYDKCDEFGSILYSDNELLTKVDIESIKYENAIYSGKLYVDSNQRVLDSRDDTSIRDKIDSNYRTLDKKIDDKKVELSNKIDTTKQSIIDNNITGFECVTTTKNVYPNRDMKYLTRGNINIELRPTNVAAGTVVDIFSIDTTGVVCHDNGGSFYLSPGTRGRYIFFEGRWRQFGMYGAVWNN